MVLATGEELAADAVFLLVGYHADWDLQVSAGIELNDRRAPIYNPETFETNVPGLFVAGGALAGIDTGTIFIENGRFHGEKIVEEIARRGVEELNEAENGGDVGGTRTADHRLICSKRASAA